jgi:hypothetical protein
MVKRLVSVLLSAMLVGLVTATPAFATDSGAEAEGGAASPTAAEEEAAPVSREEVCSRNEVVAEYCPEPYEAPTAFTGILYPLLGIGVLVTIALFLLYIRWLPNFARERQAARARGRR